MPTVLSRLTWLPRLARTDARTRLHRRVPRLTFRGAQVLTAVLAAAALLAGGAWQAASARPAEQMATVSMRDNFFQPEDLTVQAGTTVTWPNRGGNPHTSTSEDGVWDSGTVRPDGSFSFTFTEPGTYPYICEFHASLGMVGTIVVEAAEPPTPTDEAQADAFKAAVRERHAAQGDQVCPMMLMYQDAGKMHQKEES